MRNRNPARELTTCSCEFELNSMRTYVSRKRAGSKKSACQNTCRLCEIGVQSPLSLRSHKQRARYAHELEKTCSRSTHCSRHALSNVCTAPRGRAAGRVFSSVSHDSRSVGDFRSAFCEIEITPRLLVSEGAWQRPSARSSRARVTPPPPSGAARVMDTGSARH